MRGPLVAIVIPSEGAERRSRGTSVLGRETASRPSTGSLDGARELACSGGMTPPRNVQSDRNAMTGSTLAARDAGPIAAIADTTKKIAITPISVPGSLAVTP